MSLLNEYISKEMASKEHEAELCRFLKQTKDGEYAKIEKSSFAYPRVKEQREPYYNDEEYYYGIR